MGVNSSKRLLSNPFRSGKHLKTSCSSSPSKNIQYDTSWIETIETSYIVVWCDATIGADSNANDDKNTLMQLARIVNKKRQLIHIFNDLNSCRDFIKNAHNICLIVSGSMGRDLIPLIHDWNQIHSIFIFCMQKAKYEIWAQQYKKIHGVYVNIQDVCDCLKSYFTSSISIDYEQMQIDLFNFNSNLSQDDLTAFTYSILCRILISNFQKTNQHDRLIEYCRNEYRKDYQIQLIDEFEQHAQEHNAIWWFTRDSFFQRILHRALQIHDFYALSMMSSFINELDSKLFQLNCQQLANTPRDLTIYLSQLISKDDFERIRMNPNSFLCISQYLFGNTDKSVALMFVENQKATNTDPNTINVLLEISICQSDQSSVPYANIASESEFVHANEYLISMSSIYRIEEVSPCIELSSIWCIRLNLMKKYKYDPELTKINGMIPDRYLLHDINLSDLTSMITKQLSLFSSIPRLYEQQNRYRTKILRSILLHYNIGILFACLKEYNKAAEQYQLALDQTKKVDLTGTHKDSLCLIPLYSNIGLTYQYLHMNKHAFEHGYRAIQILAEDGTKSIYKKDLSSSSHFNLGVILELQGKYQEAKTFYEQALKDRLETLPNDHPDIIQLQETIQRLLLE